MQAILDGAVIADADKDDLARIEGNWYFPPASISEGVLVESPTPYTCPWKGAAQYFSIVAGGSTLDDGAWSYPTPYDSAIERVGKDFSGFVAFDRKVEIVD